MDSFNTLYKLHKKSLFNYILRMTRDYDLSCDILQESFTRVFERYKNKIEKPGLLYRVARNLIIDSFRKQGSNITHLDITQNSNEKSGEDHMMIREEYRHVLKGLQELPQDQREVLSLVAGEMFTYKEIAQILKTNENNIKVRIHRARKHLREILKKENTHE